MSEEKEKFSEYTSEAWACGACTFHNPWANRYCEICGGTDGAPSHPDDKVCPI